MRHFKGRKLLSLVFSKEIYSNYRERIKWYNRYLFPFLLIGVCFSLFLFHIRENVDVHAVLAFVIVGGVSLCGVLLFKLSQEKKWRKIAQADARFATDRLTGIFDARIVGLLYTRFDGVITEANDAFLEMIGYSRSDLEQGLISWVDMTPPEYAEISQQALTQLKARGICEPFSKEYIRKDGVRVWVMLGSSLLSNTDHAQIFTYAVNITNLKEAERKEQQLNLKIKHQQQQMFRILDAAPVAIVIRKGPKLRIEYANQTALNFTNFDHKDVTALSADEFHIALQTGADTNKLSEVFRTGKAVKGKAQQVRYEKTGNGGMVEGWFDYVWEPIYDENGKVDGVATFTFEVSDMVRANQEVAASEERFRFIADAIPHKMWTSGPDGAATYYSKGWSDYLKETDVEKLKRKAWESVHPDELPIVKSKWEKTIKNGVDMELEHRLRRHDGIYEWHLTRVCACKDENGVVSMYVGSSTNIHDQKLAEIAVRLSGDKKDEFLGIATHELRTPITSMKAALQSLERSVVSGFDPDKSISLVNIANKQVNKLIHIVDDLVDVSKIQAGKLRLNKTEYLLSESVKEIVSALESQHQGCRFEVETQSKMVVNADKIHIEQVIFNLLSNAVKYSQPEGVIHISIERVREGTKCSVIDEGIGIPEELQPFVFDRFLKVHASSQMVSGLGLGLYISSEIIKQHSGKIGVESEEGKGSHFWFILP